jgi:guanylate kinase
LFEVDPRRKRTWFKLSEITVVNSKKLPQDTYFIEDANSMRSAPLEEVPLKAENDIIEYDSLKKNWLRKVVVIDLLGFTLISFGSLRLAVDFSWGSIFGFLYLRLLMDRVDNLGKDSINFMRSAISSTRLLLPFAAIGAQLVFSSAVADGSISSLSAWNIIFTMVGFSSYRMPVLFPTGMTLFHSLQTLSKNTETDKKFLSSKSMEKLPSCIVLAGPSGVGKSTFIRKLLYDFPNIFGFSISHTTRLPREHEKDGISYYFISKEKFLEDVSNGKFIEYAQVHGNFYGTSFESVNRVVENRKICLLDLDIQGVQAVKKSSMRAMFIWIAAPSMEALESRLRKRKSETEESIQARLSTAKEEILFALRSGIFDYTVINDDFDRAYEDLKSLLAPYLTNEMNS